MLFATVCIGPSSPSLLHMLENLPTPYNIPPTVAALPTKDANGLSSNFCHHDFLLPSSFLSFFPKNPKKLSLRLDNELIIPLRSSLSSLAFSSVSLFCVEFTSLYCPRLLRKYVLGPCSVNIVLIFSLKLGLDGLSGIF